MVGVATVVGCDGAPFKTLSKESSGWDALVRFWAVMILQ